MLAIEDWLLLAGVCALGAMTPGASLAVVLGTLAGIVGAWMH